MELGGEQFGIDVPGRGVGIDEHRHAARLTDGVGRGGVRQRGAEHLVAGFDPDREERKVQCRGSGGDRHGMDAVTEVRGDLVLEALDVVARGLVRHGVERGQQQLAVVQPHLGRGEGDAKERQQPPAAFATTAPRTFDMSGAEPGEAFHSF